MSTRVSSTLSYSEQRIINNRIRRNRELKRHIIILIISIILFFSLILFFNTVKSIASDGNDEVLYKYYTSVQITSGDTLTSLSGKYAAKGFDSNKDFIDEVIYINNLDENATIYSGQCLVVPYFDVYHS